MSLIPVAGALLAKATGWLIGTRAGNITLAAAGALTAVVAFGAYERRVGAQRAVARIEARDTQAVERANEADRIVRTTPGDLTRSLRDRTF